MDISVNEAAINKAIKKEKYQQLKTCKPKILARDAAKNLGISECELLTCRQGNGVVRLLDDVETILNQLILLGQVMALTRNEECVHERTGIYNNPSFFHQNHVSLGLFVNSDIDLRLFMDHWKYCFACAEPSKDGIRKSIQFFDKSGMAVHKVYLTPESNEYAYDVLVKKFQHDEPDEIISFVNYEAKPVVRPDTAVDWQGFRLAWDEMQDTHEFVSLLKQFRVGREQGFRNVGGDYARRVSNDAMCRVLEMVRDRHCEIMIFVGNRGCIQIHTGPVVKLNQSVGWSNVLDPIFNLHLNTDNVAGSWVTRKPTSEGVVSALELFNSDGETIATLFGKRRPGEEEQTLWKDILAELPAYSLISAA